ncbi:MAG: hypothetical protein K0R15_2651 [Clostridiales bacterium]|jgi:hypothetical protein|nr:hypothetical protein [Clostridiales bacterium]
MVNKIKEEYIIGFIDKWSVTLIPSVALRKSLLLYIFATLPVAFLGSINEIITPLLLVSIIIMSIWATCIYKNVDKYKDQVDLFIGVLFALLSIVTMIGSYKLIVTFRNVSYIDICKAILGYLIIVAFILVYCIYKIRKGCFVGKKSNLTNATAMSSAGAFGAVAGSSLSKSLGDNTRIVVLAYSLLFLSYMLSFAYIYLLKYYFVKKLGKQSSEQVF